MSGVKSALPGQGEPESVEETGDVLVAADDASTTAPPEAGRSAKRSTVKAPVKAPAAKAPVKKAPAAKKPPAASPAPEPAVDPGPEEPTPSKPAAKKRAATKAPVPAPPVADEPPAAEPAPVPVPEWTADELDNFRTALETDIIRLREELNMGAADMADLLADSSDGAGDDQADAGSKTLEREQEMSVNANARDLLDQSTHALRRLEAGTYGICESCGTLIPAARLRAFPRATLCIACKQAEERR
jgi:RNA polymerase-binding protein DksA